MSIVKRIFQIQRLFLIASTIVLALSGCSSTGSQATPLENEILSQLPSGWKADTSTFLTNLEKMSIPGDGIISHFSANENCQITVIQDHQAFFDGRKEFASPFDGWLGSIQKHVVAVDFDEGEQLPDCLLELFSVVQFDITYEIDGEVYSSGNELWTASKENISKCLTLKAKCIEGYSLTPPEKYQDSYWVGGDPIIKCRSLGLCCMDELCDPRAMSGTLSGLGGTALDSSTHTDSVSQNVIYKSGEWNILFEVAKTRPALGDVVVFGDGWIMYWDGVSEQPPKTWFEKVAKVLGGQVQDLS